MSTETETTIPDIPTAFVPCLPVALCEAFDQLGAQYNFQRDATSLKILNSIELEGNADAEHKPIEGVTQADVWQVFGDIGNELAKLATFYTDNPDDFGV